MSTSSTKSMTSLRKTWAPLIKIAVASSADVFGDWNFYRSVTVLETDPDIRDKYALSILIFFCVSIVMSGLTILSVLCKGCCGNKENRITRNLNRVLALEILLEDIPQFVLATLVTNDRGLLDTKTLINVITSAYNFVFNILDMLDVCDDDEESENAEGVPLNFEESDA